MCHDDRLSELRRTVGEYEHLGLSEVRAVSGNTLSNYVVICRAVKVDHELTGPHDAVRLIVSAKGTYRLLVYDNVLEEGDVGSEGMNSVLSGMNESSWIVCPGVTGYISYRSIIGYDIRGAKSCSWPPNVARDVGCQVWYHKDPKQRTVRSV